MPRKSFRDTRFDSSPAAVLIIIIRTKARFPSSYCEGETARDIQTDKQTGRQRERETKGINPQDEVMPCESFGDTCQSCFSPEAVFLYHNNKVIYKPVFPAITVPHVHIHHPTNYYCLYSTDHRHCATALS